MKQKRFSVKETVRFDGVLVRIIVDNETGVNYLSGSGIGLSGMTPLLDQNGRVVIDYVDHQK